MLHSPIPGRPSPRNSPTNPLLPLTTSVQELSSVDDSAAESILGTLRGAVMTGASELGPILNAIAEAAVTLTNASGAALALRRDGAVTCRARAGETAPPLGAVLSDDSGISGECLRSGKALRCDDTLKDYRVNPDVCRALGLRSIAAVPLSGRQGRLGILEVFATRPYAFDQEAMNLLGNLAELAETAQLAEPMPRAASAALSSASLDYSPAAAILERHDALAESRVQAPRRGRNLYRIAGIAVAALGLITAAGWRTLFPAHPAAVAARPALESAPSEEITLGGPSAEVIGKPSPAADRSDDRLPSQPTMASAQAPDIVKRVGNPSADAALQPAPQDTEAVAEVQRAAEEPAAEPKLPAPGSDNGKLASLVSTPAGMPELKVPVSQGVAPGTLERKVSPVYPQQALTLRLEGSVVLDATIGTDGKIHELKIVKGHPLLAQAAINAVRQWRYRPYQLNGNPITMEEQITVSFKAP